MYIHTYMCRDNHITSSQLAGEKSLIGKTATEATSRSSIAFLTNRTDFGQFRILRRQTLEVMYIINLRILSTCRSAVQPSTWADFQSHCHWMESIAEKRCRVKALQCWMCFEVGEMLALCVFSLMSLRSLMCLFTGLLFCFDVWMFRLTWKRLQWGPQTKSSDLISEPR